jgi:flavin-dependent dehydrogenase
MVDSIKRVVIVGAGISGLLLAQYLQKSGIPFRIFERDTDFATRGVGWGLTLHWSLPALKILLPYELFGRLPEAYVDRVAVEQEQASTFPFFDLSTGELKASTPNAPESQRIRVSREKLRLLLASGIDIQVCKQLRAALYCRKQYRLTSLIVG